MIEWLTDEEELLKNFLRKRKWSNVQKETLKNIADYDYLEGCVGATWSGTFSFGVGTPNRKSTTVKVTTAVKTAKSAAVPRTCQR